MNSALAESPLTMERSCTLLMAVEIYKALWTRDFSYMVENAGDLIPHYQIRQAILYLLKGQREDGCIPDRVQGDGRVVYSAGAPEAPLGDVSDR